MSPKASSEPLLCYGRQWITDADIAAVTEVLKRLSLTQGPKVGEFERALAEICGSKHAVAVNSGTAALHIACLAAGIGPGDEVITSPITFVASANCAIYCGAKPVFADIDPATGLMSVDELAKKIGPATRAVIPVHFAGQSAPMAEIAAVVRSAEKKFGKKIYLIEDAAHALGATYKTKPVGNCSHSDMTILSFHPVKHITTGEGGAVLTNDSALNRRLTLFRSHGITRDLDLLEDTSTQPWGYEQHELGYNYRITDIQCALGLSQLQRLPEFVRRRREIAAKYRKAFADRRDIGFLADAAETENSYHLFVIQVDFDKLGGRSKFMARLNERGLITQVHYIPVHTQPYFKKKLGTKPGDFPKAESYYRKCLSIPMFPAMTDDDVNRVIREIQSAVAG